MTYDAVQSWLLRPKVCQEYGFVCIIEQCDFSLDSCTDCYDFGALLSGVFFNGLEVWVVDESILVDIGNVHHRLRGDQVDALQNLFLQIAGLQGADRQPPVQVLLDAEECVAMCDSIFLSGLRRARGIVVLLLDGHKVGQGHIGVDCLDIVQWPDAA